MSIICRKSGEIDAFPTVFKRFFIPKGKFDSSIDQKMLFSVLTFFKECVYSNNEDNFKQEW